MSATVYAKVLEARKQLQAVKLTKTGLNKFSNYIYFELADFLPAVTKICTEIGLCGVVSFTKDEAKLTLTAIEDGSFVEITSPMGRAELKGMHEIQNIGAVQTYMRRYLWMAAMDIVEHDALDGATAPAKGAKAVAEDAWKEIAGDRQESIRRQIADVMALLEEKREEEAAKLFYSGLGLSQEEQLGAWSLIGSKQRSAIKRGQELLKGNSNG